MHCCHALTFSVMGFLVLFYCVPKIKDFNEYYLFSLIVCCLKIISTVVVDSSHTWSLTVTWLGTNKDEYRKSVWLKFRHCLGVSYSPLFFWLHAYRRRRWTLKTGIFATFRPLWPWPWPFIIQPLAGCRTNKPSIIVSGHAAYHRVSLIDLYLHTIFH